MNRQEFVRLVEGSQVSLRRFLASLCSGDVELAEDIAQEVYIKAFLACDSLSAEENFNAWVTKIAYNTFLNNVRRQRINLPIEDARGNESDLKADSVFKYENLYQALSQLPLRDRTAITLFYLEGYSTKEISKIIDIKEDAVRQILVRGRRRLKILIS